MNTGTPLNQIALSVRDLAGTVQWYRDVLQLEPAGGTDSFKGYIAEKVQGLSGARSNCWWLLDAQGYFQIEFFEFEQPRARPMRKDAQLRDLGYQMVGFHVSNFDATLERARNAGSKTLSSPMGMMGKRRVCLRCPEGVLLELMEDDPLEGASPTLQRNHIASVARSVTVSVADIEQARQYYVDTLGMVCVNDIQLHAPEHSHLWLDAESERKVLLLQAGGVLVELVQYIDPEPRPRINNARINDQGLLNIALGFRSQSDFNAAYRRCRSFDVSGNWRPLHLGAWSVVYVNDPNGLSVELLMVRPWYDARMGFAPKALPTYKKPPRKTRWSTAIITGGGSGIGMNVAETLLGEGSAVGIIDRDIHPDNREQLQRMAQAYGGRVSFRQVDVTDTEALDSAVASLCEENGSPDLALNCAGIQNAKPFSTLSADEFERVVRVNLMGSRNFAAAALPYMQPGSQLSLMASLAGLVPSHSYAAYNASKYGVVGLAGALRLEYIAAGIEISAVCPPEVDTPMVVEERKTLPEVAGKLKDAAGSLSVDKAGQLILKQLEQRKVTVIPGIRARGVAMIARLFPGLMRRFSERIVIATAAETDRSAS